MFESLAKFKKRKEKKIEHTSQKHKFQAQIKAQKLESKKHKRNNTSGMFESLAWVRIQNAN